MLKAKVEKYKLNFKLPAGTSRGVLTEKWCWFVQVWDDKNPEIIGTGEASIIKSLSHEWSDQYEQIIEKTCQKVNELDLSSLTLFPSIRFAFEMALKDLENGGNQKYYLNDFSRGQKGIKINGLIWMGEKQFMYKQLKAKLELGFDCVKLKIGAIDFEDELDLLRFIRSEFSSEEIEIRADANGAFKADEALEKLKRLSEFELHSIEQPIKQKQWQEMAQLCEESPIDIALDEELIGLYGEQRKSMLDHIKPPYIILKPSLLGGFKSTDEWINLAEHLNINWWITSALESNIGLNALAQYVASKNNPMPQGLGTGQLFKNNIDSTLQLKGDLLFHH